MATSSRNKSHRAVDPRGDWLEPTPKPPATVEPAPAAALVTTATPVAAAPVATTAPDADKKSKKDGKDKKAKKDKEGKGKDKDKKSKKRNNGSAIANGSTISAAPGLAIEPISPRSTVLDQNTARIDDRLRSLETSQQQLDQKGVADAQRLATERKAREEKRIKEEADKKSEADRKAEAEADSKEKDEQANRESAEAEKKAADEAERMAHDEKEKDAAAKEEQAKRNADEADRKAAAKREKEEVDKRAKEDAEKKVQDDAERKVREESERKAKKEAEKKAAKDEADRRKVAEDALRKDAEEAERRAKTLLERATREEAERLAKAEVERKQREEIERKQKEVSDRKAKEEGERKAKEQAEKRVKDEAEKKEKAERNQVARKAREEEEKRKKEEAEKLAEAKRKDLERLQRIRANQELAIAAEQKAKAERATKEAALVPDSKPVTPSTSATSPRSPTSSASAPVAEERPPVPPHSVAEDAQGKQSPRASIKAPVIPLPKAKPKPAISASRRAASSYDPASQSISPKDSQVSPKSAAAPLSPKGTSPASTTTTTAAIAVVTSIATASASPSSSETNLLGDKTSKLPSPVRLVPVTSPTASRSLDGVSNAIINSSETKTTPLNSAAMSSDSVSKTVLSTPVPASGSASASQSVESVKSLNSNALPNDSSSSVESVRARALVEKEKKDDSSVPTIVVDKPATPAVGESTPPAAVSAAVATLPSALVTDRKTGSKSGSDSDRKPGSRVRYEDEKKQDKKEKKEKEEEGEYTLSHFRTHQSRHSKHGHSSHIAGHSTRGSNEVDKKERSATTSAVSAEAADPHLKMRSSRSEIRSRAHSAHSGAAPLYGGSTLTGRSEHNRRLATSHNKPLEVGVATDHKRDGHKSPRSPRETDKEKEKRDESHDSKDSKEKKEGNRTGSKPGSHSVRIKTGAPKFSDEETPVAQDKVKAISQARKGHSVGARSVHRNDKRSLEDLTQELNSALGPEVLTGKGTLSKRTGRKEEEEREKKEKERAKADDNEADRLKKEADESVLKAKRAAEEEKKKEVEAAAAVTALKLKEEDEAHAKAEVARKAAEEKQKQEEEEKRKKEKKDSKKQKKAEKEKEKREAEEKEKKRKEAEDEQKKKDEDDKVAAAAAAVAKLKQEEEEARKRQEDEDKTAAAAAATNAATATATKTSKVASMGKISVDAPEFVEEGSLSPRPLSARLKGAPLSLKKEDKKEDKKEKDEKKKEEKKEEKKEDKKKQEKEKKKEDKRRKEEEKERERKEKEDTKKRATTVSIAETVSTPKSERAKTEAEKRASTFISPRAVVVTGTPAAAARKESKPELVSANTSTNSSTSTITAAAATQPSGVSVSAPVLVTSAPQPQPAHKAASELGTLLKPEGSRLAPGTPLLAGSGSGSRVGASPSSLRRAVDDAAVTRSRGVTAPPERELGASTDSESKQQRQRKLVMQEILNTERDYVRDLVMIREVYLMPLREKKLLSEPVINAIFSNVTILFNLNKLLLKELTESISQHNGDTIGACFLRLADYLKMYSQYCTNQPSAVSTLNENVNANQRLKDFLLQQMPSSMNQNLASYLIRPVQRLCKYPLLLRELLKFTEQTHADHGPITQALTKIEAVVAQVNSHKRTHESAQKLQDLQRRLVMPTSAPTFNPIAPNRSLIMDGMAKRMKGDIKHDAMLYCFNDFFIWCRVKPGKSDGTPPPLKLKSICALQHCSVAEGGDLCVDVSYNPPDNSALYVQRFQCTSAEERAQWVKAIEAGRASTTSQQLLQDARRSTHSGPEEQANKRERTMAPWQEQWTIDMEKFYSNKDTKEVAWELPQYLKQLLDEHGFLLNDPAVPRPVSQLAPPTTPNPNPAPKQDRRRVRKSASIQSLANMKELAAAGYYDT